MVFEEVYLKKKLCTYLFAGLTFFMNPGPVYAQQDSCLKTAHTLIIREDYENNKIVSSLSLDKKIVSKTSRELQNSEGGLVNMVIVYNSGKQPLAFLDAHSNFDFRKSMKCKTPDQAVYTPSDNEEASAYFVAEQFMKQTELKAKYNKKSKPKK